jgi:VWFA-related protein
MHSVQKRLRVRSIPRQALGGAIGVILAAVALCGGRGAGIQEAQQPRFAERVDVSRVIVDVRVTDNRGGPIVDLVVEDFAVKIDGKAARVESARWVGGSEPRTVGEERGASAAPMSDDLSSPGRLIVFVFQKNWEGFRIRGLMEMLRQAGYFLDTLTPADRVAILSFDSHLKIWVDFTNDLKPLRRVLNRGILMEDPPPVQEAAPISLVARLSQSRGQRTYNIEKGLRLIAEALEPLPGSKALVLFGHGFGRFNPGLSSALLETSIVDMENGYEETVRALVASRASVFSLDVTRADYHSLELGLQRISEETGGFYERTHLFPEIAMKKLAGALAGYYVLLVEKPVAEPPASAKAPAGDRTHRVEVELTRRKGNVYAKTGFD